MLCVTNSNGLILFVLKEFVKNKHIFSLILSDCIFHVIVQSHFKIQLQVGKFSKFLRSLFPTLCYNNVPLFGIFFSGNLKGFFYFVVANCFRCNQRGCNVERQIQGVRKNNQGTENKFLPMFCFPNVNMIDTILKSLTVNVNN